MKHIIILGDGMADWHRQDLGGKTLLQYVDTPHFDWLASHGQNGLLQTIPEGFHPGSEVANSSILGYDQNIVYEGRGPLEAASIGVELEEGDLAMRCNFVCIEGDIIKNHSCGRLETEEGDTLIKYLNSHLANERVHFYTGVQYRHLLVIKGGNKHLQCTPPHDVPLQTWRDKVVKALVPEAQETAQLLNDLILKSQELLPLHPLNIERHNKGMDMASSIWPWGGGYRPQMTPLTTTFPQISMGSVITAVDLIRGIGKYAGLNVINVPGATGLWDTNYEAKAEACIKALEQEDFVYVHVEASDEAGHDGDLQLKLKTIENLDKRFLAPVLSAIKDKDVAVALLPDHPTPVELRTHTNEPVPFCIYKPGVSPDEVQTFDEDAAKGGILGLLHGDEFIKTFMS